MDRKELVLLESGVIEWLMLPRSFVLRVLSIAEISGYIAT